MPRRKITIDFLQDYFNNLGCELLEDTHKNSHTEMSYICANGHETTTTWNNFSKWHGCLECSGKKQLTTKYVRSEFEKIGFELLTDYKTAKSDITYICDKGHERTTSWDKFRNTLRCPACMGLEKHSYEFVKQEFLDRGFKLLAKSYENAHQRLQYQCENGHTAYVTYNKFKTGDGCRKCFYLRNRGENHPNYNPNLSEEDRIINRDYVEYHNWRLSVYKRDKYRCVICGSKKDINAHHLHNYADYPLLRIDVGNGATLCLCCHVGFHSKYGKVKNTVEQFEEYKNSLVMSLVN